jgi:hypothetical protein
VRALTLAAVLLLLPTAVSTSAYEDDGVLAPGIIALGGFQTYSVRLEEGQRVDIALTGPGDGLGLDAIFRRLIGEPFGGCGRAHAQGPGTLELSYVAEDPGLYFLGVRPIVAAEPVGYHVRIAIDDAAPEVGRGGADLVLGEDAALCTARSAVVG